jgi:hypothetical protein
MSAVRRRRPHQTSSAGVHLAVGLFLGGFFGSAVGLYVGVTRYIEANVVVVEHDIHHPIDPAFFTDGGPADDDCASDPRVAWPLLGLVAGAVFGVCAAQAYDQVVLLLRGRGSGRMATGPSRVGRR